MQSLDEQIIKTLAKNLDQNPAWLFTVVSTWGSSPRPPGSLLVIDSKGTQTGSVSGGCVEDDLLSRIRNDEFLEGCPRIISYGVSADQAHQFGLPCGGHLELLVEYVTDRTEWQTLHKAIRTRSRLARRVNLKNGETNLLPVEDDTEFQYITGQQMIRHFGPHWQLIIIGASVISQYLVPIARSLGYRIIICDPRKDAVQGWDMPHTELENGMPDDVVRSIGNDSRTAVVALTHDPKLDDLALMEALPSAAFYVGALGSRSNNQKRRQRLRTLGLSEKSIARLHGPIGLPIGGRTPPEIAVSIAAELISERNRHVVRSDLKNRELS